MTAPDYAQILRQEIKPALGCTEPIAVALAVARAREALGGEPDAILLRVSRNILKNAMGVGIPGTGMVGLEIASALSSVCGHSSYGLEVLSGATEADCARARELVKQGLVSVAEKKTDKKLYIEAEVRGGGHTALCVIQDTHTGITQVERDGEVLLHEDASVKHADTAGSHELSVAGIFDYVTTVDVEELSFLRDVIAMNDAVAQSGLEGDWGMRVGKVLQNGRSMEETPLGEYVSAYTAAAADARMAGCTLPVMSTAGSGNQGICASLPVAATARKIGANEEAMLRAEALSQLITIHIKTYIGRLSPLCGCAIASSIGSSCGVTYLLGGGLEEIQRAIKNMVADISGLICDGAKSGCALKIASSVASAIQCANLALAGVSAGRLDGIIADDVEATIRNLGNLGCVGMDQTDRVILDMMIAKE